MRILIAGSVHGDGGYEEEALCGLIAKELKAQGQETDFFLLPYGRNMLSLPDQILAYQLMDASDCDLLVTIGYPACMLKHPNKICYLLQTEPMLFEYWDSAYGVLANRQYANIRAMALEAERGALNSAKKVMCGSDLLQQDLKGRLGIDASTLLYPLLCDTQCSKPAEPSRQPYWLCESTLLPWQRPNEILNLFDRVSSGKEEMLRLFISNSDPIYVTELMRQISLRSWGDRVHVLHQRADMAAYQGSLGILHPEYNSRRISASAVAAMALGKPIVAYEDCGALRAYPNQVRIIPLNGKNEQIPNAVGELATIDPCEFTKEVVRL